MSNMLLPEPPSWADQLSAWSTFATAVLALVAGAGAVGTFIVAWKAYERQRAAFDEQSTLFREQIKQLEEDRRRREEESREQQERQLKKQLAEARQVTVDCGSVAPYGHDLVMLIKHINVVDQARSTPSYPAAYTCVTNRSPSPIMDIEATLSDAAARYCWISGRDRLQYEPKLDYLASGSSAYFVHADFDENDIPHATACVQFTDESGQRWQTDQVGKTKRI